MSCSNSSSWRETFPRKQMTLLIMTYQEQAVQKTHLVMLAITNGRGPLNSFAASTHGYCCSLLIHLKIAGVSNMLTAPAGLNQWESPLWPFFFCFFLYMAPLGCTWVVLLTTDFLIPLVRITHVIGNYSSRVCLVHSSSYIVSLTSLFALEYLMSSAKKKITPSK